LGEQLSGAEVLVLAQVPDGPDVEGILEELGVAVADAL
jgi:hypothetical protein